MLSEISWAAGSVIEHLFANLYDLVHFPVFFHHFCPFHKHFDIWKLDSLDLLTLNELRVRSLCPQIFWASVSIFWPIKLQRYLFLYWQRMYFGYSEVVMAIGHPWFIGVLKCHFLFQVLLLTYSLGVVWNYRWFLQLFMAGELIEIDYAWLDVYLLGLVGGELGLEIALILWGLQKFWAVVLHLKLVKEIKLYGISYSHWPIHCQLAANIYNTISKYVLIIYT